MNTTASAKQHAHPVRPPKPAWLKVCWIGSSPGWTSRLVRQAAGELARECHNAVWEATYEKARGMSRDEARGYIRAFAPEFLLREVDWSCNAAAWANRCGNRSSRKPRNNSSNWSSRMFTGSNRGGQSVGLPEPLGLVRDSTAPHSCQNARPKASSGSARFRLRQVISPAPSPSFASIWSIGGHCEFLSKNSSLWSCRLARLIWKTCTGSSEGRLIKHEGHEEPRESPK